MKLGIVALVLIGYTAFAIQRVMPRLPERIPTSFNSQGHPMAWSSPDSLWIMLAIQAAVTVLILAVPAIGRRAPQLVNLGWKRLSDYPPAARARIMPLLEDMCGWMAVLFSLFFALLIRELIRTALHPGESPGWWPVAALFAGIGVVTFYYLRQFSRVAKQVSAEQARTRPMRR